MTYKTILAVFDSSKSAAQVADFATALAETFEAHLIGIHAETIASIPIVAPMELPDPVTVQALQDLAGRETEEIETIFRDKTRRETLSTDWRSFMSTAGYATAAIIDSARSADLVIAGQRNPDVPSDNRTDLENFLFESGRPVLLVPHILKAPKPVERVLIAWDGSREAARATFDALPFLKRARHVEVFTVDTDTAGNKTDQLPGAEIAATLARHGVTVTAKTKATDGLPISALIENRLSDKDVDLLVMGAYSHSRLWEMLFGGVTKTVLHSMTALTLLSR